MGSDMAIFSDDVGMFLRLKLEKEFFFKSLDFLLHHAAPSWSRTGLLVYIIIFIISKHPPGVRLGFLLFLLTSPSPAFVQAIVHLGLGNAFRSLPNSLTF